MDDILEKYYEWELHTAGCTMCRLFETHPKVRVVCDYGRGLIMQMMLMIGKKARGL